MTAGDMRAVSNLPSLTSLHLAGCYQLMDEAPACFNYEYFIYYYLYEKPECPREIKPEQGFYTTPLHTKLHRLVIPSYTQVTF
jgi:hypothetical protein